VTATDSSPAAADRPDDATRPAGEQRAVFILNPRAGAGKAGRHRGRLERAIAAHFPDAQLLLTERPRHATELAAAAAPTADLVVAVGGDGTCHEVVNGLCPPGESSPSDAVMGMLPFGTGSDLQRSLDMPDDLDAALAVLARGPVRTVDVGEATFQTPEGPRSETFINVAGFGINGEVVKRANQMDKRMGGTATFFVATLRSTLRYTPPRVRLKWRDGETEHVREMDVLSCFLANAQYCGGGMWVGKGARMDDGLLDVTALPPDPVPVQLVRTPLLYDGRIGQWPGSRQLRTSQLEVEAIDRDEPVWVDLDGEMPGCLPATFSVHPRRLRLRARWSGSAPGGQAR
jgi:YegS/Rv2252/BmrU family lipid kinase